MKISDLNKITVTDIKSYFESYDLASITGLLSWNSIKERVLSNPMPIIFALAMIITLISVSKAHSIHKNVIKTRKTEVSELRKRAEKVTIYETTQKHYRDFLDNVPEAISESKLIEMLSEIAIARNVQIISFSPVSTKGNNYIDLTSVGITIASEDYADTIRFVNDIENSPHSIRIGKWSGDLKMPTGASRRISRRIRRQSGNKGIMNEYIEAKIEIETVRFKK